MIVTKIWGGLGNQMFEYAAGKSLAMKNKTELKLDISGFNRPLKGETKRLYRLDVFPKIKDAKTLPSDLQNVIPNIKSTFLKKIYRAIIGRFPLLNSNHILECSEDILRVKCANRDAVYLDGYWQSENFFIEEEKLIREKFDLNYLSDEQSLREIVQQITEVTSVSIHVRRGDYVTSKSASAYHGACDLDYYSNAVKRIIKLCGDNVMFFIFSDDLNWCKENLIFTNEYRYIQTSEDYYDLYLMSLCKHNIIANSSFSWWAAWLNRHNSKIVIAPSKWFLKGNSSKSIIPVDWLKI